ncbi:MAG: hypothetical protein JWL77_1655 [Chthonomonadaceae bacterium]|nr:hypothetical protein [Chthonomonadaceae bacterium]
MALKRSGVRASFAPSFRDGFPRIGRYASLSACSRLLLFPALLYALCLLLTVPGLTQQNPSTASPQARTDVMLFVHPDSPSTARIGLSYRKLVPHKQVEKEIAKLLSVSGWKLIGKPAISDASARPDNPKRFPPTTSAEFSVADAPQFHDNAPVLAPYLQAFQEWDRIEIMFVTTDLVPYNGVTDFHDPALDVTLTKSDGVYDYRIAVREHLKKLPDVIPSVQEKVAQSSVKRGTTAESAPNGSTAVTPAPANSASVFWPYTLILVGGLLVVGVACYLYVKKHQDNLKPGRSQ